MTIPACRIHQRTGRHRAERQADAERGAQQAEHPGTISAMKTLRKRRHGPGKRCGATQTLNQAQYIDLHNG